MHKPLEAADQPALEVLEWPKIHQDLISRCWTPFGMERWVNAPFLKTVDAIQTHLVEVDAVKRLIIRYGEPSFVPLDSGSTEIAITDIRPVLQRLAKKGELSSRDAGRFLVTLHQTMTYFRHFQRYAKKEKTDRGSILESLLESPSHPVVLPEESVNRLTKTVSPDGEVLDEASLELARLRGIWRNQRDQIQKTLQTFLHHPDVTPILREPLVTERENRFVLPVRAEFKHKIPGIIHAGSARGATVYVEPQQVVSLNNRLQTLETDIQKEVRQVLRALAEFLDNRRDELLRFIETVGRLDRLAAAARQSRDLEANLPELALDSICMDLKKVRHPLLLLHHPVTAVVPNDVTLGWSTSENQTDCRTLIVTGPNTGGKTVLLKTLGLCALMIRAGLHLPVGEASRISVFDPILADIGDQQSIDQNLSTFSAHLQQLQRFVADETDLSRGLVLIDEICAGTDPAEGAALARAVLETLYEKGALTIVTTHLGELKLEGHQQEGYLNASVAFDPERLLPTYRLMVGLPGASNALTIAQRLGLNDRVVNRARRYLSRPHRESATLLEELEFKNLRLSEALQEAETYHQSAKTIHDRVEAQRYTLESEKRRMLHQFRTNLTDRIHQLDAELRDLKTSLAQDVTTNEVGSVEKRLRQLNQEARQLFETVEDVLNAESVSPTVENLRVGMIVESKRWEVRGSILSLDAARQEAILQAGQMKITVPFADIHTLPHASLHEPFSSHGVLSSHVSSRSCHTRISSVPSGRDCHVIGLHVEEALEKVEQFLDQAALAGYEKVSIVHGHGAGILKKAIRGYLNSSPYVKTFYPGDPATSGDGQTIVELV